MHSGQWQFYGDRIVVDDTTAAPFGDMLLSLNSSQFDIYPTYTLAYGNTLKLFRIPFYYIPLYISDRRKEYYDLPFPALEVKQDVFHGSSGAIQSHYFLSPELFGNLSLRLADVDGIGAKIQQIVRLSDHNQFDLELLKWQKTGSQAKFGYTFKMFDDPPRPNHLMTFQEQSDYNNKVAQIEPPLEFNVAYSHNEENNRSIIDRDPDLTVTGRIKGIADGHEFTLTPTFYWGRIMETRIYQENLPPLDVSRDYVRTGAAVDYSFYLETPYIRNKALVSLDFHHSNYEPGEINQGRLDASLTLRRPVFGLNFFFYELKLTKLIVNYGQSPFYFEQFGLLQDSGSFDLYLKTDYFIAGNQWILDITNANVYNDIYYFGIKVQDNNYAVIEHDQRQALWEFGIMSKELAF